MFWSYPPFKLNGVRTTGPRPICHYNTIFTSPSESLDSPLLLLLDEDEDRDLVCPTSLQIDKTLASEYNQTTRGSYKVRISNYLFAEKPSVRKKLKIKITNFFSKKLVFFIVSTKCLYITVCKTKNSLRNEI